MVRSLTAQDEITKRFSFEAPCKLPKYVRLRQFLIRIPIREFNANPKFGILIKLGQSHIHKSQRNLQYCIPLGRTLTPHDEISKSSRLMAP